MNCGELTMPNSVQMRMFALSGDVSFHIPILVLYSIIHLSTGYQSLFSTVIMGFCHRLPRGIHQGKWCHQGVYKGANG